MKSLSCALALVLCACGGAIDTTLLDGGDGGGGGGNDGGGGQKDGQPQADCNALYQQVQSLEAAATACCPTCNVMQCTQQVDGLCCPLTVDNPDSSDVKAYESALKAFRDANCSTACPAIACATKPSGQCMQSGNNGSCAQL